MGDRSTSMLFLVVLLFLAFVQSLPLSDKHYKSDKGKSTTAILDDTGGQHQQNVKKISGLDKFSRTYESPEKNVRNGEIVNDTVQNSVYSDYESSNSSSLGALHHRQKRANPFSSSHIGPCMESDRHYCLNAGTCVMVISLDIRICRCMIPYTGVRCEMIDIVYLFSQLPPQVRGSSGRRPYNFGWQ